jgi:tetratricopeptide (TPR) repeat protein
MPEPDLILFIAKWDRIDGIRITDQYPEKSYVIDLEHLAWKIFFFFENFYLSDDSNNFESIIFQLPIREKGKIIRVLIDSFPPKGDQDKFRPYLIAILLPDYFPEDQIGDFDEEIRLLNEKLRKTGSIQLNNYMDKIYNKFNVNQTLQDAEISLDEAYTYQKALKDFKKGLKIFSEDAYKISYMIIKKSYLEFKRDNNLKLLLEATYFIATILNKLHKYREALDYYRELEELARSLEHQKYYEKALFMAAFCSLKIKRNSLALNFFEKLASLDLRIISQFDFYFLYGKTLRILQKYEKSTEILTKAIEAVDPINLNEENKKQLASAYFELAHSYFFITTEKLLHQPEEQEYTFEFQRIIHSYEKANKFLEEFKDYPNLIISNQIIGNIYEKMDKRSKAIIYYRRAIEYTKENNDVLSRMRLFDLIINNLMKLGKKMQIIKEIDEILFKIKTYAFLNLPQIARYHVKLGRVYVDLGRVKEALSEFLIALDIYEGLDTPAEEHLDLLDNLISIYSKTNQLKFREYYMDKREKLQQKIANLEINHSEKALFDLIKDLWILTSQGELIFSHAPEYESNSQLLSGFLSATMNFSFEMTSSRLNTIKLGFDQFYLYGVSNRSFIVIGRASINQSEALIRKRLKVVFRKFDEKYGQIVDSENYTPDSFTDFIILNKGDL